MGGKAKKSGKRKAKPDDGGNSGKLVTDARFASVHADPRFREPPRHKAKVEIDRRFHRMFSDKNFATSKAPTDKRGKLKKKEKDGSAANSLEHYYRLDYENGRKLGKKLLKDDEESESEDEKVKLKNDDEESGSEDEKVKLKDESDELSSEDDDSEEEEEEEVESDDTSSTSDTSSTDSDEEDVVYEEELEEEKIPEIDKETNRLAVVNMDWSQVRAVDLYVLLSSFLQKRGHIVSVSVYPSEFGLKRMAEEAIHGPVGLFDDDKKRNDDDQSEEDDDDDDDADDEKIDQEKLRAYELSRLRYYFAVVECDSIATADYLYKNCDGLEFERSSAKLDLRFIPDSMDFKHQPRDVAKDVSIS